MTARHRVLVVEDDVEFSLDLQQILKSLKCESVSVTNAEDAIRELKAKPFCMVLLDLEIKSEPGSNKAHVRHGNEFLRDIRQMYSEHKDLRFWLPVVVISGFARERDVVLELMRDGATDVIEKPDTRGIPQAIRKAFIESGRETHDLCESHHIDTQDNFNEKISISIPGDRVKQRTTIRLGSHAVTLTNSSLRVLLHLIVGHRQNKPVHKTELGSTDEQGFKGVSNLHRELKQILRNVDAVENHYFGFYSLAPSVTVGEIAYEKLLALEDARISDLVAKLQVIDTSSSLKQTV